MNALTAVTQPDPYPYYAALLRAQELFFDAELGLWVALGARAVSAVLGHPDCRVRPASEPVPRALLDAPAAEIFRHLVRMNDHAAHGPFKRAIAATLNAGVSDHILELGRLWAGRLPLLPLTDFAFALPVHALGAALGVPEARLSAVTAWLHDFVRCLAPGGDAETIARGQRAAARLLELFHELLRQPGAGLLHSLALEARRAGRDSSEIIVANAIGLLSQSFEATAGLLGNAALALGAYPQVLEQVLCHPWRLEAVLREVLRFDPPVQNTRRFAAADLCVLGQDLPVGATILLVLAAANRDPALHREPHRFNPARDPHPGFSFGLGAHACPGDAVALGLARAGLERLLASDTDLTALGRRVTYRASSNTRVPVFAQGAAL